MSIPFYYSQFISIGPGINRNCILIKAVPFSFGCSFGAYDKVNGLSINLCKQWETSRRLSVPSSFNESFFGFPANWWLWELIAKRHFMMIRFSLIERLCWRPFAIETQLADCRLDWIGWSGRTFGLGKFGWRCDWRLQSTLIKFFFLIFGFWKNVDNWKEFVVRTFLAWKKMRWFCWLCGL